MSVEVLVVLLALLALVALVLTWSAGRLDHLHTRVERMAATLDAELLRRSAATLELATSGVLDPATSMVLADAAHQARTVEEPEREAAESALTEALLVAFDEGGDVPDAERDPVAAALVGEVATASRRVRTARRLHNDTVAVTRARRRAPFARVFHLAGRAGVPEPVEFDDRVPPPFAR